ncbi:MAG: flavin reductase [Spirochaetales bacterium]|nr:flavin reductase [Spirochaetales bacterium]
MSLKEINPTELGGNVIDEISNKWMLLAAGNESKFNFMTVSWGMMGEIWFEPAITAYVRESRYTKEFIDSNELFSMISLKDGYKKALQIAGSKSGRDIDKVKETGLTPLFIDGVPSFEEAAYTIVCKKMYADFMPQENFIDKQAFKKAYPEGNLHTMYIGKILKVYLNK